MITGHEDKTMSELIDEITSRTKAFVLIYAKETVGDATKASHSLSYGGGICAASGLARYADCCFKELSARMASDWVDGCEEDND